MVQAAKNKNLSRRALIGAAARSTAAIGLLPLLGSCCPCAVSNKTWNNALRLDGVSPDELRTPTSLAELIGVVKEAEAERKGVRMTGSGHSFSDVAFSGHYMLSPRRLSRKLTLDMSQLRSEHRNDSSLVRVESGIRLRELNPLLFASDAGLSLSNLGGYDAQTIVGAAMTGTHGSGIDYGPIASQIVSIELVGSGGKVFRIEPRQGITDARSRSLRLATPEGGVDAELIADDEIFNAVAVSLGCMGVVYAVVLRAEPRFWLREERLRTTWTELRKPGGFIERLLARQSLDPEGAPQPDYYEIYVNPYPSSRGEHHCVLTKRYKLKTPPTSLSVDERKRGRFGSDALRAAAELTGYGARLVEFTNAHPERVPRVIDDSLQAVVDKAYVARSYDVFNLGPANLVRAYGIELAFDVRQTIAAVERLFVIAAQLRKKNWMHSSPPSLRFVKASPCQLAMMYGRDTMMLEMGMLACADGADELLTTYEETFIAELKARPHWGLDLNVLTSFDEVRALYPASADRWLAVYDKMNAKGTFNGAFTERLGINRGG